MHRGKTNNLAVAAEAQSTQAQRKQIEPAVVNGIVHTGRKQQQRVWAQISRPLWTEPEQLTKDKPVSFVLSFALLGFVSEFLPADFDVGPGSCEDGAGLRAVLRVVIAQGEQLEQVV